MLKDSRLIKNLLYGFGDTWFGLLFFTFLFSCLLLGMIGSTSLLRPKIFNGYYVISRDGYHCIWIDWENRFDEKAYQTNDFNEFKEAWTLLTENGKYVVKIRP